MAADLSIVVKAVDHATGVINNVGKAASGAGHMMGNVLKAGALGAAVSLGALVVAGIDFVKQAMEEEAGIKRLAAAVDANGGSWAANGAAIEAAIKAREKLAFSDDDLRSSLAMLTAQTGDVDEALRRQLVAMDLARGANIDLGSASKLLGKVTDESHGALSRLGIVVDKNADSAEVLAAVQQRFGGQSAAFAESAQGKWARVGIAFDNIKETIGGALLPVVTQLGDKLARFLEEHEDDIKRIADAFVVWATEAIPKVVKGVQDIADEVGPLLAKLEPVANWFIHNKTAITAAAVAIGAAVVLMFTSWAITAGAAAVATILAAAPVYALVAAVAILAAGIFLLIKHWDEVTKWVKEHMTVVLAVAAALTILFPPLGILIALIALAIKHWDEVSWVINHVVIPAFHTVMAVINGAVIPAVSSLAGFLTGTLWPAFNAIVSVISDVVIAVGGPLLTAFLAAKQGAEGAVDVIGKPFRIAYNWTKKLVEWVDKLIDALGKVDLGILGDVVEKGGGFIGDVVDRARQHGGPVSRGMAYLVGERGPELFSPGASGMISPNSSLGGVTVHLGPVYLSGTAKREDVRALVDMVTREMTDRQWRGR